MAHTHLDRVYVTTGLHFSFSVIMWFTHPTRTLITPCSQNNHCSWTSRLSPAHRAHHMRTVTYYNTFKTKHPKTTFRKNSQGSQDNISQPQKTPETCSSDTLSLSPTSPLLSFSKDWCMLGPNSPTPSLQTLKNVRPPNHQKLQAKLSLLLLWELSYCCHNTRAQTLLSDMCQVPAILAATFTNI